jgi:copper chaperone CopZ
MKSIFTIVLVMAFASLGFAQQKKTQTTSFSVGGVCEMCKARIERAVDVKGVKSASYDLTTHQLQITYQPAKITEEKIHQLLNEAGHDTSKSKATDEQYDKVHGCCKYREHENH